jgi:hypothetical protein
VARLTKRELSPKRIIIYPLRQHCSFCDIIQSKRFNMNYIEIATLTVLIIAIVIAIGKYDYEKESN